MMKNQNLLLILFLMLFFSGCNSKKKTNEVASYSYKEETVKMSDELKAKAPDWVEKGKICFGLIVQIDKDKNSIKGKPIKAKILQIGKDAIKMKALETVSLVEVKGCTKMGLSKGEIWDEKDGDLYLTRQEAINFLKAKHIYKFTDKVTVD
ncbi:MAG: hypothetical protein L3J11_05545 [Draconibacterium sp.]|nr:hypothetical protein [Draconibacterium sp.]